eukprot:SAG31_NODE_10609_length_1118_cov_0.737978_1_plen_33_part_01
MLFACVAQGVTELSFVPEFLKGQLLNLVGALLM